MTGIHDTIPSGRNAPPPDAHKLPGKIIHVSAAALCRYNVSRHYTILSGVRQSILRGIPPGPGKSRPAQRFSVITYLRKFY